MRAISGAVAARPEAKRLLPGRTFMRGHCTRLPGMQAGIPYTAATGEKLVNETFGPNNIHRKTSGTQEWHAMEVRDGRHGPVLAG